MKRLSRKTLIIAAAVLVLLGGSASAWYITTNNDEKSSEEQAASQTEPPSDAQFPGPTEQEQESADQHKDDVVKQQELESKPATGQKAVTPIITNASQTGQEIFASAYVPGVFEDGGTCTFSFTNGSKTVTRTTKGAGNVSTTNCENVQIARSEFAPGDWRLVVTYESPKAKGASAPRTFKVE